ncbi:hypothetical protein DV737_g3571, partial [Chaetothyriales sp. CBS 132003]
MWLENDTEEGVDDEFFEAANDLRRHGDDEVDAMETRIAPGDVVLLERQAGSRALVLCIAKLGEVAFWLHSHGQWSTSAWRSLRLNPAMPTTIHNFASEEELAPLVDLLPTKAMFERMNDATHVYDLPKGDLPRHAAAKLVERMKALFKDMKRFRRAHLETIDALYERVADDHDYRYVRFEHLVEQALGVDFKSLDAAARMSAFLAVWHDSVRLLLVQPTSESALSVLIVPKTISRNNAQVIEWSRRYQQAAADASKGRNVRQALAENPLSGFIDKARRIILKSRRIRSPTTLGFLGPSNQAADHRFIGARQDSGEVFSEAEQMIVRFIWDAYWRQPQPRARNKHHGVASLLLRAVGAYPNMRLDSNIGRLFLQEIGCGAPWSEGRETVVILPIPGQTGQMGRMTDLYKARALEQLKDIPASRSEGPFPLPDTLAHIRKDLGDMPVLCIDHLHTQILDDGISLEPSPDHEDAYWIHVHIAHPSAFFDPAHPISQAARRMGATLYASGARSFMIDHNVSKFISLGPGVEAFTVSTLLRENGEVLDVKVAATTVNNVVRLQHDAVGRLMGLDPPPIASIVIGPDLNLRPASEMGIPEESLERARPYLPTLQKLMQLLRARFVRREQEVPVAANWLVPPAGAGSIQSWVNFEEENDRERLSKSFHYLSDPTIKLEIDTTQNPRRLSTINYQMDVVAHAMLTCGESFGKWLSDRQIPAVFHGNQTSAGYPIERLNEMTAQERIVFPSANIQADPVPHATLNLRQFCRVTSPLRRFPDLMSQWNADAYLRAEAAGLVKNGAPATAYDFPITKTDIQEYIKTDMWAIGLLGSRNSAAAKHWLFLAMFRAFHFNEAVLPELWDVQMRTEVIRPERFADSTGQVGSLAPLHMRSYILRSDEGFEQRARVGQYLPCKIVVVDPTSRFVGVKPVGEATDKQQFEWKDIVTPNERRRDQTRFQEVAAAEPDLVSS